MLFLACLPLANVARAQVNTPASRLVKFSGLFRPVESVTTSI
jgi:hypothetical protein